MKKVFSMMGALAVGAVATQAASPIVTSDLSKPWSVSASLRGFYDDNYNTTRKELERDTFGLEFSPSAKLNLQFEQTLIRLEYIYGVKYFEDRDKDPTDQTHEFNGFLRHMFSDRYKLELSESFAIAQEPEVLESQGVVSVPVRTEGDNFRNTATADFYTQLTEVVGLVVGYANTFYNYEQEGTIGSRSALLDRVQHLGTINLRWQIQPTTVGLVGYQYGQINYTSDDDIDLFVPADVRDNRSHYFYVGADHQFNPQLNGAARVGVQHTDYYNSNVDQLSPYIDINATYLYAVGSHFQIGLRHARNATDVGVIAPGGESTLDQESTTLYGALSYQFTPKWTGSAFGQYQLSEFQGGLSDGDTDNYYNLGLNLNYQINTHWSADAGYTHDHLESDLDGRTFSRNRIYLGLRVTY